MLLFMNFSQLGDCKCCYRALYVLLLVLVFHFYLFTAFMTANKLTD